MISHISIGVPDLTRSGRFFDAALASLGYVRLFTNARSIGYAAFVRDPDGHRIEAVCLGPGGVAPEGAAPGLG